MGDDETKAESLKRSAPFRPKNESARTHLRVSGRPFEQPSPEVCSPPTLRSNGQTGNGTNGGFVYNFLVGPAGIEPATLGLEIRCSIRLSYGPSEKSSINQPIHKKAS